MRYRIAAVNSNEIISYTSSCNHPLYSLFFAYMKSHIKDYISMKTFIKISLITFNFAPLLSALSLFLS